MTEIYTVPQVAAMLGHHPVTIRQLIARGELDAISNGRRGTGARYRITARAIDKYLAAHTHHP